MPRSAAVGDCPKDLGELGERRIISLIRSIIEIMPSMAAPFGDDVSAVPLGDRRVAVLKADMLVGNTDVPPGMSLWQAARKAVVMNVSDFAAKGVAPRAVLVSLGVPRNFLMSDIAEIARGLNAGARQYGAYIVGGDTSETKDLTISILLFGTAERNALMLRKGAKPGDVVAVTGAFGKTAAGLRLLLNGYAASQELREVLLKSVCMPEARLKEGLALSRSKAVTASIDSSDGLAWSLHEIAHMSDVGFLIETLPMAPEVKRFAEFNRLDSSELVLYGGEEYELVVTINPRLWKTAEKVVSRVGGQLLPIGKVTRTKELLVRVGGETKPLEPKGYEHFKT
jgi:thiamine-monophosphate kinase